MRNIKTRKTISDAQLNSEIVNLLEQGKSGKTDLYGLLRTRYKLGRDRYFKTYDIVYPNWQKTKEQATVEQVHANTKEGLESGLKSKIERMLQIQGLIDSNLYEESVLDIKTGKVVRFHRKLKPAEIKGLHEELSKMGGDYAPTKTANTNPDGSPVDQPKETIIIYKGLPPMVKKEE